MLDPDALSRALVNAAAVVGALGVLGGFLWFWVGPRIKQLLADLQATANATQEQLQPAREGSTAHHAATAARAAAELPKLREQLHAVLEAQERFEADRIAERLQLVELETENHARRIGSVEQAVINLFGGPNQRKEPR